jgi:Tfp pilus assembly protein PilO
MSLSSRDQMILAVVVIMALAVAAGVFLIYPQFNEASRLDQQVVAANDAIAQARTLRDRRQEAKNKAAATQAQMLHLSNQIPDAPQLPSLIIDLQDSANDAGVEMDTFVPTQLAAAGAYSKVACAFVIKGQWNDVLDYLRRLNDMDRAVRVTVLGIAPVAMPPTSTAEPDMNVAVQMEAYVTNSSSAPVAPAAPAPPAAAPAAPSAPGAGTVKSP